ncbi:hypothetical protein JW921_03420 [Candidatus Fermentibacterales bacterium]|nr:hypothetical protein [Candidatus Fermentibacterales bacterium]
MRVCSLSITLLLLAPALAAPAQAQQGSGETPSLLGDTLTVVYEVPRGYRLDSLAAAPSYYPVSQDNGVIRLIALDLDTLPLPAVPAIRSSAQGFAQSAEDTVWVEPPAVVVGRVRPDTLCFTVQPFPGPAPVRIPPGLPGDYLRSLEFWDEWSSAPADRTVLVLLLVLALPAAALATALVLRRRSRERPGTGFDGPAPGRPASSMALDLLESPEYASGDWPALYASMDRIQRLLVGRRFGLACDALTHRQMGRRLGEAGPEGRSFIEKWSPLVEEVRLQRYAAWGTSRERAERDIRSLAALLDEWWKP